MRKLILLFSCLLPALMFGQIDIVKRNVTAIDTVKARIVKFNDNTIMTTAGAGGGGATTWGAITGTLSNQLDLWVQLNLYARKTDTTTYLKTKFAARQDTNKLSLQIAANKAALNAKIAYADTSTKIVTRKYLADHASTASFPTNTSEYDGLMYTAAGSSGVSGFYLMDGVLTQTSAPYQITLPGTYKIPFNRINTQIVPYTVTSNITITPDTASSKSGASTAIDLIGDGTHTVSFSGFSFANDSQIDSFIPTSNYVSTYLSGKIGKYTFKIGLQDYKVLPGVTIPVQLSAPSSFQATAASATQINLSWAAPSPNGRNYQIYDSIVGTSTNFTNLLASPVKSATSYNHTGLSNGQTVYYKIRTVGSGTDTLTSTFASANATTSNLTTLSTPTNNIITGVSNTSLTANVSDVSVNASYLALYYKLSSSGTWTTFSSTLPRTTTSQAITGLTPASSYDVSWIAIGDGVTYGNSARSTDRTQTTHGDPPTLVSTATSTDGLSVVLTFNKTMAASPSWTGISFSPSRTVNGSSQSGSTITFTVSAAFASTDNITISYTPGTITSGDNGILAGFTGQSVTNNVVAGSSTAAIESISGLQALHVSETNSDFTFTSGALIQTWLDRSTNNRTLTRSTGNRTFDLANKKVTGTTGNDNSRMDYVSELILGTGDFTIFIYEDYVEPSTTIQWIKSGYGYMQRTSAAYDMYWGDLTHSTFSEGTVPVGIKRHVIIRNGTDPTWQRNEVALTRTVNTITASTPYRIQYFEAIEGSIQAIVIFNRVLDSGEITTVLNTLNTVLTP